MSKFKETLKVIALLAFCLGIPVIGWELLRIVPGSITTVPSPTYAELTAIILTAVTVVLAVLAIIVAILAVWGYQSIKTEASNAADRAVKSTVESVVAKHATDESVKSLLRKELEKMFGKVLSEQAAYPEAFPSTNTTDTQQGTVGTEYPKGEGDGEGNDRQTGA